MFLSSNNINVHEINSWICVIPCHFILLFISPRRTFFLVVNCFRNNTSIARNMFYTCQILRISSYVYLLLLIYQVSRFLSISLFDSSNFLFKYHKRTLNVHEPIVLLVIHFLFLLLFIILLLFYHYLFNWLCYSYIVFLWNFYF